ncbi:MAG: phosphoesterase, partial [Planctomycetota bacterium]
RGALVSDFYNQTSVLHTMQRILGLPPMNQMDAMAPVMTACFTERPDFRPYTALPSRIPLDEMNKKMARLNAKERHWAKKSLEQNFDIIDGPDDNTLNRILWHWAKGVDTPYPVHLAGAHATGLTSLDLILVPEQED